MILAEKIVQLRKQVGWSQEELADKMGVTRQSVSKWESTNSIPDINKIIALADIFGVSTDFLLKDEKETVETLDVSYDTSVTQIGMEQANQYVDSKLKSSMLVTKGVGFCVCSAIPLFFLLAMAENSRMGLTESSASAIGVIAILAMVSYAISLFIKTNQFESDCDVIDNKLFELSYGVHGVFQEKLKHYQGIYNRRLSVGIFLFIFSFVPIVIGTMFFNSSEVTLLLFIVLLAMITAGLSIVIPASAKYEAYNNVIKDGTLETVKAKRAKRAEKLAAFYWPLVFAVYLGWSFWTMNWGITWIVWPIGAAVFVALVGLMELLEKEEN